MLNDKGKRQKAKGKRQRRVWTLQGWFMFGATSRTDGHTLAEKQRGMALRLFAFCLLPFSFLLTGCRQDMHDQPKYKPLTGSAFFEDGRSSRPLVSGTVARGQLKTDEHLYTGKVGDQPADAFPFPITRQILERGHEQYNIHCAVCHGEDGEGQGMIVQRGFKQPPTLHDDRLRQAAPGQIFNVITKGIGTMYPYAPRVSPEDRWAIVAYIRALQLSQNASLTDVPEANRKQLVESPQ